MGKNLLVYLALTCPVVVGACGSGGGDDAAAPDASGGDDIDAPGGCDVPDPLVVDTGGVLMPSFGTIPVWTSTGEVAVFMYDGANGEVARYWDGSQWATSGNAWSNTNGGFGRAGVGELDGRAVIFADVSDQSSDSDRLRYWAQQASGDFATGQTIDFVNAAEMRFSRTSADGVLLGVGGDQQNTIMAFERGATGTWTAASVDIGASGSWYGAGVGTLGDGTAVVAGTDPNGLELYRRTGATWALYHTLASGGIFDAHMEFPPDGAPAGASAVALFRDPSNSHPRGLFIDVATGAPTSAVDLAPTISGATAVDSDIAFETGANRGKILVVDGNFSQPHAWIIPFENGTFSAAEELRPDLVFEGYPHLFYDACAGYMILHATRAVSDPSGSAQLLLEPLDTFAPGV
jgi:hypothetical protein